ncbi:multicomponent Na+:H+ antiporter subunit E [Marinitoga hydrogenitolerans DSM 16785]|uniref:Multicomponent Na+:H+ antiporter subunit E n=1 Tax=Marinitoga hydrogenitolerans (strain DSM 16785 / JCM 12826 / AT1271) TaxID=1122195 RepID=A0A1M4SLK2_MARH1|nr:Na+/H+ antiporter subunit E [Marinitoga hydrogenitolerans]SHE33028.1 multicomponent Na+:H+ antiporter subunit E [Marinitoga hydrogenitolerans DSM 16785]
MIHLFIMFLWLGFIGDINDYTILIGIIVTILVVKISEFFLKSEIFGFVELFISAIGRILPMYKMTFLSLKYLFKKSYCGLIPIDVENKTEAEKAAIANCITLTPGTMFILEEKNHLIIHKFDKTPEDAHSSNDVWRGELF